MSLHNKNESNQNNADEQLSKEDMKRVDRYLSSPINKVERKTIQSEFYVYNVSFLDYLLRDDK